MAALPGFEPRLTESESAVLPLDDKAMINLAFYIRFLFSKVKYFFSSFIVKILILFP